MLRMGQGMISRLFAANTSASERIERHFGWQSDKPFWTRFEDRVKSVAAEAPVGSTFVDLGGGRRCVWYASLAQGAHLVAVDIDQAELDANDVVSDKRLGDAGRHLPFEDASVDVIVSRALLEHVQDVATAVGEMGRVVRPGGRVMHFVPARNALFALAARLGPFELLKRLVHRAIPDSAGQVEFPVFYDQCTAKDFERLFRAAGFSKVSVEVCYAQSGYFHPVLPVYLLVAAYQGLVARLGLRQLAAYVIIDAIK